MPGCLQHGGGDRAAGTYTRKYPQMPSRSAAPASSRNSTSARQPGLPVSRHALRKVASTSCYDRLSPRGAPLLGAEWGRGSSSTLRAGGRRPRDLWGKTWRQPATRSANQYSVRGHSPGPG